MHTVDFSNRGIIASRKGKTIVYHSRSNCLDYSNIELVEAGNHAIGNLRQMTQENIRYGLLPSLQKKSMVDYDTFRVHDKNLMKICEGVTKNVTWALRTGVSDIFYAVIMHKFLGIAEKEMKDYIVQSMTSGYGILAHQDPKGFISLNYENFCFAIDQTSSAWNEQVTLWKSQIGEEKSIDSGKTVAKVMCPFALTSIRNKWIDDMWELVDEKYFPMISVRLQHYRKLYAHLTPDQQALIGLFSR